MLFNPRHTASYFHISVIGVGRHTYNYFIFTIGYKLLTYGLGLFTEKRDIHKSPKIRLDKFTIRKVIHNLGKLFTMCNDLLTKVT